MSSTAVRALDLVHAIVCASEKAANIARACRAEQQLLALLTEEKKEGEKNPRFVQDFKTLADVLVQETIKHDIGKLFPALRGRIHGEESNKFTNANGDTIRVEVRPTPEATAELLSRVLDGNNEAAEVLAAIVHSRVPVCIDGIERDWMIDTSSLGVWIDPIDSTSEYIAGKWEEEDQSGVAASGLQCVCVLIGAYRLADGVPLLGVINQPFRQRVGCEGYTGKFYWCLCLDNERVSTSIERHAASRSRDRPVVLVSTSETPGVLDALEPNFVTKFAAGAGYKLLCVALGVVDAYVISKPTTFRWDTCAPHAFLKGLGGGIVMLHEALHKHSTAQLFDTSELQVGYDRMEGEGDGSAQWCNASGIVAYCDLAVLEKIIGHLGSAKLNDG